MYRDLIDAWPIITAVCGGGLGLVTWWSILLWRVSSNVATSVQKLTDHAILHQDHSVKNWTIDTTLNKHEARLCVLEALK